MTDDTRLTLRRPPAANPVKLVFGEREGLSLSFWRPPVATPGPVKLLLGDDGSLPPETPSSTLTAAGPLTGLRLKIAVYVGASVQAQGVLTGLRGHVTVRAGSVLRASGVLAGLRLCIATRYDIDVQRPTVGNAAARWRNARTQTAGTALAMQGTQPQPSGWHARWQHAIDAAASIAHPLPGLLRATWHALQPRHQDAARLHSATALAHQIAAAMRLQPHSRFQSAHPMRSATRFLHQDGERTQRLHSAVRWQLAQPLHQCQASSHHIARPYPQHWRARYQEGVPPPPGIWTAPPPPPGPGPCYVPTLPALLLFADPFEASLPAHLLFVCDRHNQPPGPGEGAVVVPVKKVYIVLNHITLTRIDTGAPLHALAFSASLDVDSWTWQWSATLHESAGEHLARQTNGDPPEVLASINANPLRLVIERVQLSERFLPQKGYQVSGRGRAAILSSPWAPVLQHGAQASQRTAAQLAQEVLTINGVGIGWSADWQMPDWTVPEGAWTHSGSYIEALTDIAQAVGGTIQPHPTDAVLHIQARYPRAPWEWHQLTPDVQLPRDAVQELGTEYIDKPAYNGVHVGGVQHGVFGPVTRAGTVGDKQAPQVTHPLITDATAHRLRGLAILSDTGHQRRVTLSMQVLPETGLIVPGKLVQVGSGASAMLGMVRSTAIEWGKPRLRQNLELEVHDL